MAETTQVFTVADMTCDHCKMTVTKAAKSVPGVAGVDVDLAAKTVKVSFDPAQAGPEKIKAAIEKMGYTVR